MAEYFFESDEEASFEPIVTIGTVVLPYQYEPRKKKRRVEEGEIDEHTEREIDFTNDDQSATSVSWCKCKHCVPMPKKEERKCCMDYEPVKLAMEKVNVTCITKHPGFNPNCQNIWVLQRSFYEFIEEYGPVGDEEPVHKLYRYVAYRIFVRWMWGKLGRGKRLPLPACVVSAIRSSFPEENQVYTGFYKRGERRSIFID